MSNELEIRTLARGEESDWRRLWTAYLDFYETSVPEHVYKGTFERLIDPANTSQNAAIALKNGVPVGLVHYIVHPHNWKLEDVVYLQDLYTDVSARGAGVGRALIEYVYAFGDQNGTPGVYWLTQDFNAEARMLYDRIATLTPFIRYNR